MLVGASLGAYIAARVAARAGSGIAHLVLLGGLARMPVELSRFRMEIADKLARGDAATADVLAATAASVASADELTAELKALLDRELGAFTRDDLIWHLRATEPTTTDARAVGFYDVPTTVLHGRRDQAVPFPCGEALAAPPPDPPDPPATDPSADAGSADGASEADAARENKDLGLSAGCANAKSGTGLQSRKMMIAGIERTYLRYIPPSYDPKAPMATVIGLHGSGGTSANGWDASAATRSERSRRSRPG